MPGCAHLGRQVVTNATRCTKPADRMRRKANGSQLALLANNSSQVDQDLCKVIKSMG